MDDDLGILIGLICLLLLTIICWPIALCIFFVGVVAHAMRNGL